ncbi:MAG: hypothetical protein U0T75_06065 [Chitinophagales bacterium]
MRKTLIIGVMAGMLFSMFGVYLFFAAAVSFAKFEAKTEIENTCNVQLTQFNFSAEEFASLSRPEGDDDEVLINGELYDVKHVLVHNGKITVTAYRDANESDVVEHLIEWVGRHTRHGSHGPVTQSFFMPYYAVSSFSWCTTLPISVTSIQPRADKILSGSIAGILIPPPNCVPAV